MKSIITGGAGFIGSHLVDYLLNKDHEITVLDNFSTGHRENLRHVSKKINLIECDISKKGKWEDEFVDANYVFHLASLADIVPSIQKPDEYYNANVHGTFNILQSCRKVNIKKLVYAASSSCYGIPGMGCGTCEQYHQLSNYCKVRVFVHISCETADTF